ncbi:MAG: hypothetical protein GY725_11305 [bacterium]|nr:hypothetical protein [bacterium]
MRQASVVLLVLLFAAPVGAEDRIHVEVHGSGGRDYQVAVQRFQAEGEAAAYVEPFYRELTQAITFSSVLEVVSPDAFLEPVQTSDYSASGIACENWRGIGADILLQGKLELSGERLRARFKVWDILRCREQGDRVRIDRHRKEIGLLARTVADEIVERFSGRRGVSATQIAFISDKTGNKELYLMNADGSNKRAVTNNNSINLFPSWSPDGKALVYTSYKGGRPDVWTLFRGPRKGGRLLGGNSPKYRATWSPTNGSIALVMNQKENTDLYTVNSKGGKLTRLTTHRSIETSPAWSPDGKRVAFVSDRTGSPQIYIKELGAASLERRITFKGGYNASPAWSPTGEWIAYTAQTGTNFDLYLIDPETGYTTPLVVHPRSDEDPAWSPDGRKIVFRSSRKGRKNLYRIDVDGRNLTLLTEGFRNCSNPAWSGWLE